MDLSELVSYEREYPVDIKHPVTGKKLGIRFMVKHLDCHAASVVSDRTKIFGALGEDAGAEVGKWDNYAACISSWDWGENTFGDMGVPDYSPENAAKIMNHPSAKWIVSQVIPAVGKIGNFTNN